MKLIIISKKTILSESCFSLKLLEIHRFEVHHFIHSELQQNYGRIQKLGWKTLKHILATQPEFWWRPFRDILNNLLFVDNRPNLFLSWICDWIFGAFYHSKNRISYFKSHWGKLRWNLNWFPLVKFCSILVCYPNSLQIEITSATTIESLLSPL